MTRLVHIALLALTIPFTAMAQTKPETPADLDNPPANATRTAEGLVWYTLTPGSGDQKPKGDDYVKVRYAIFKEDGMVLDYTPTALASVMSLERMMPGWRDVVSGMTIGQKTRIWLPSELSGGKMPDGAMFVIDTELVDIIKGPKTPSDLENPPEDATRSKSGLVSMMIREGNGDYPTRRSKVVVNYSGWTTDGRLFDSTILRGLPAEFRVSDVIAGWTEGLQLMQEGETRRFWVPSKLAYAKDPSKPQGTLVF